MKNKINLEYRDENSDKTLRQGLIEYYKKHPYLNLGHKFLGQQKAVVLSHDICHVIFGCGATSADELIVETWTVLGTKITIQQYGYMIRSGLFSEILGTFGIRRLLRRLALTSSRILFAVYYTQIMKRKWNHFKCAKFADIKLNEIRKSFGIRIA